MVDVTFMSWCVGCLAGGPGWIVYAVLLLMLMFIILTFLLVVAVALM